MHTTAPTTAKLRRSPWLTLVAVVFTAACAHSPQAAVPQPASVSAQARGCGASARPAALRSVDEGLKAQGLALKAQCNPQTGAWAVQVIVVDGMRASKVVRGPLADGGEVDMGTPSGVLPVAAAQDFSPDVHHNRQWLRALMERHQFVNLPDAWWHYAQQGAPLSADDTDLAAR